MNRQEHILTIAAEECSEVAHRISKALRFGLGEIQPGQNLTNGQRIMIEFHELLATFEMLMDEFPQHLYTGPFLPPLDEKQARIEKFLMFSVRCGTLDIGAVPYSEPMPASSHEVETTPAQPFSEIGTNEPDVCSICNCQIKDGEAVYTVTGNHYDCVFPNGQQDPSKLLREMDTLVGNLQRSLSKR